jgi:hypothetical protein
MSLLLSHRRAELHSLSYASLALKLHARGEQVDMLCVDTPYSARTHAGHNALLLEGRRDVAYDAWTPKNVHHFVSTWSSLTRGWMVSITDHVLMPAWAEAFDAAGRYVFAPLPLVVTGSRVRMRGDGPSPWSYQVVVARPRSEPWSSWGTLPGAYVGKRERLHMTGGKPLWAMLQILEDYSRPGDVVCDPCCGAGTTLIAGLRLGRMVLGADASCVAAGMAELRTMRELELITLPTAERRDGLQGRVRRRVAP